MQAEHSASKCVHALPHLVTKPHTLEKIRFVVFMKLLSFFGRVAPLFHLVHIIPAANLIGEVLKLAHAEPEVFFARLLHGLCCLPGSW